MYNYWKCRVVRGKSYWKRKWVVVCIETDIIVAACGTWARAIKVAIKFIDIQTSTHGKGYTIPKDSRKLSDKHFRGLVSLV